MSSISLYNIYTGGVVENHQHPECYIFVTSSDQRRDGFVIVHPCGRGDKENLDDVESHPSKHHLESCDGEQHITVCTNPSVPPSIEAWGQKCTRECNTFAEQFRKNTEDLFRAARIKHWLRVIEDADTLDH